jgi:hypothetical protein
MTNVNRETWKANRARLGGQAARRTNQGYYLRRIVGFDGDGRELLACGHAIWPREDMIGPTNAIRRRCPRCPKPAHGEVDLLA